MSDKIEELREVRIQKLEQLKKLGIDPYPVDSRRTHKISEALEKFDDLSAQKAAVSLVGRIRSVRTHGKLAFFDLEDEFGRIQLLIREDAAGEAFRLIELLDLGDFLEALFHRPVELVTPEALSPYIGPNILNEVRYPRIAA